MPQYIGKTTLLISSNHPYDGGAVEAIYTPLADNTDASLVQLGNVSSTIAQYRANLLGYGAKVKLIRWAGFEVRADSTLRKLSQDFDNNFGQGWSPVTWSNVDQCMSRACLRTVGAGIVKTYKQLDNNLPKRVWGTMAFAPIGMTQDGPDSDAEHTVGYCRAGFSAIFALFNQRLAAYATYLFNDAHAFERGVAPRNAYPVIAYSNSNPTTNPPTPGSVSVSGNLTSLFVPGAKVLLSMRSRSGRRSALPENLLRGNRTVINSVPVSLNNTTQINLSCSFSAQAEFDPCLSMSISVTGRQNNPLLNISSIGYGRPRRASKANKK